MSKTKVYIAGVGLSPSKSDNTTSALVSAAVKALLDAGVTYDNVTRSIIAKDVKNGQEVFDAFNDSDITVDKISAGSEMRSAVDAIGSGKGQCVLVVAQDKVCTLSRSTGEIRCLYEWCVVRGYSICASIGGFHDAMAIFERLVDFGIRRKEWRRSRKRLVIESVPGR